MSTCYDRNIGFPAMFCDEPKLLARVPVADRCATGLAGLAADCFKECISGRHHADSE